MQTMKLCRRFGHADPGLQPFGRSRANKSLRLQFRHQCHYVHLTMLRRDRFGSVYHFPSIRGVDGANVVGVFDAEAFDALPSGKLIVFYFRLCSVFEETEPFSCRLR